MAAFANSVRAKEHFKRDLKSSIVGSDMRQLKALLTNPKHPFEPQMLNEKLDPNTGYTALHLVVIEAFEDGLQFLINNFYKNPVGGANININQPGARGETALHLATEKQLYRFIELLLSVDVINVDAQCSRHEATPLHQATQLRDLDMVKLLISSGASVTLKNIDGNTALHTAVLSNSYEIVKELLSAGADPKAKNSRGKTPMYLARIEVNNGNITNILISHKPPPGNRPNVRPQQTKWSNGNQLGIKKVAPRPTDPQQLGGTSRNMSRPTFNSMSHSPNPADDRRAKKRPEQTAKKPSPQPPKDAVDKQKKVDWQLPPNKVDRSTLKSAACQVNFPPAQVEPRQADIEVVPHKHHCQTQQTARGGHNYRQQETSPSPSQPPENRRKSIFDPKAYYKMNAKPRGICLIINNETYWHDDFKSRPGADVDERRLDRMFRDFGYIVKVHKNLSAKEIFWTVTNIARDTDHTPYDSFVCCILSHGTMGTIYGIDGQGFRIAEITVSLNATQCPSLAGKPKMFFLQACRGDEYPSAVHLSNEHDASVPGMDTTVIIPDHADFLLGYATVAGYRAQRHREQGSIYIQTLCEHLEKHAFTSDLLTILTRVNNQVSTEMLRSAEGMYYKQIPEIRTTLRKKIRFA